MKTSVKKDSITNSVNYIFIIPAFLFIVLIFLFMAFLRESDSIKESTSKVVSQQRFIRGTKVKYANDQESISICKLDKNSLNFLLKPGEYEATVRNYNRTAQIYDIEVPVTNGGISIIIMAAPEELTKIYE